MNESLDQKPSGSLMMSWQRNHASDAPLSARRFFVSRTAVNHNGSNQIVLVLGACWMFLVQPCLTGIDEYRLASGGRGDFGYRPARPDSPCCRRCRWTVSLPLLERLNAAGLTLSQLQLSIRELLPTNVFRRRTDDGREYTVLLTADEVTLSVAEYRPVYVNGDVAKPGQQTFRAGLTVRQALALAGG